MSRSNQTENAPNPAVRWFEWNGETGGIRFYDKTLKKNIDLPLPFGFILLDRLGSVTGWHEASKSGIYSNEVKDTRETILTVKAFKGGTLGEGLYADIKDRVNNAGGRFTVVCYIAFKQADGLKISAIKFAGAALGAWMEFEKAHRNEMYKKAIIITGFEQGKKGKVEFRIPTFALKDVSEQSDKDATALDIELQEYLKGYFARAKHVARTPVNEETPAHVQEQVQAQEPPVQEDNTPIYDDDIPFAWLLPLLLPIGWVAHTILTKMA